MGLDGYGVGGTGCLCERLGMEFGVARGGEGRGYAAGVREEMIQTCFTTEDRMSRTCRYSTLLQVIHGRHSIDTAHMRERS